MTGRQLFNKYKWFINGCAYILAFLPNRLLLLLLDICRNMPGIVGIGTRYILVKSINRHIGDNLYIARNVTLKNIDKLIIGDNCSIMENCYVDAIGGISIGDNVSIAHNSSLVSFDHGYKDQNFPIKYNPLIFNPIVVEDDVWVGCGVRILAGALVSRRSIVAAGSIVIGKNEPNSLLAGVPASAKKRI